MPCSSRPPTARSAISAARVGPGHDTIEFSVADTGPGIPPEESAIVFEAFRKGSTSGHGTGPGLGLSLVRNFVSLHGGSVNLDGEAGHGTAVTCRIPANGPATAAGSTAEIRTA